ncbi:hypothetical protein RF55_11714 [Lasius niger]|uniref:Uncharacterized protein n=1 Tax=Lasius niger TaxID=67767 RepID=A0A0J7N7V6_LASNI|nr:hypothetical protein RF55_11714 [Lasius niger]
MVGDRVDSDLHPVEVWMESRMNRRIEGKEGDGGGKEVWDEKGRKVFKEKLGRVNIGRREEEDERNELEGRLREAIKDTEKELGVGKERKGGWWNEECEWKKKEVREELRRWRRKG